MLRTYEAVSVSETQLQDVLAERALLTARVKRAMARAAIAHCDQRRDNGGSYLEQHIYPVASDVVDYYARGKGPDNLDEDALIAALLHDTVEDSSFTLEECEEEFGARVAEIVWRLTKVPGEEIAYIDKLSDPAAPPVVQVIKSADRINNLNSSIALLPDRSAKMRRYIRETNGLYVPLADMLLPEGEYGARLRSVIALAEVALQQL